MGSTRPVSHCKDNALGTERDNDGKGSVVELLRLGAEDRAAPVNRDNKASNADLRNAEFASVFCEAELGDV